MQFISTQQGGPTSARDVEVALCACVWESVGSESGVAAECRELAAHEEPADLGQHIVFPGRYHCHMLL
jgi:hypothetical protein